MDETLVATLGEESFLPETALRRAIANPESIADAVLSVLERASVDPDALNDHDVNLLFWGVHALAAASDRRLFTPLLRFLRSDADVLDGVLGDAVAETLPLVLASAYDEDEANFYRFLLDTTVDDAVRNSGFTALAFLTREGRVDPASTHAFLTRFDEARIAVEGALGWIGWEEAIAYLGFQDLVPRAEAARRDGRILEENSEAIWFKKAMRQVTAVPPNYTAFEAAPYGYLTDPIGALAWTAEGYGQPVVNPVKDIGRNDPCPCGSGRKFKKCCLGTAA